jgi:Na+/phosphate symporter
MNPGSQVQDTQVSDANLKKAATAYTEVAKISQQFQQQIQGVENQEKIRNLQQSANNQMIDAIESQDLDLETYNSILEKVRVDEEIRAKFMNIAQSMQ